MAANRLSAIKLEARASCPREFAVSREISRTAPALGSLVAGRASAASA